MSSLNFIQQFDTLRIRRIDLESLQRRKPSLVKLFLAEQLLRFFEVFAGKIAEPLFPFGNRSNLIAIVDLEPSDQLLSNFQPATVKIRMDQLCSDYRYRRFNFFRLQIRFRATNLFEDR